jgi:hypothetical protein
MRPHTAVAITLAATLAVVGASAAPAAENPQPDLEVSRNGETITIRTALATDEGGGSVKLFFSSATPTCEEVLASMRSLAAGEVSFELTRTTWGDGSTQWMAYYAANTEPAPEGTEIEVDRIDPTQGATSTGRIEARLRGFKESDELRVAGTFETIGCGGE